jgi:acyl carrier protein
MGSDMDPLLLAKDILRTALQLGARANALRSDSPLMGSFPEFNSLTVVAIVSAIEEHTGCAVNDAEITAGVFETVGSLADFIERKLG